MLARRKLPREYAEWNETWGAPFGRRWLDVVARRPLTPRAVRRARGTFVYQPNSTTRTFEYPWAYDQLSSLPSGRILEIGGALSGFQFAMAKSGYEVHNVDPFIDYGHGSYGSSPASRHSELNELFDTNVVLHHSTLTDAHIDGPFSAAVCVSTLEHLPAESIESTLGALKSLIMPGGLVILTVDLFLNLVPFCSREENTWGSNVSVSWLQGLLGYEMLTGDPVQLFGYPEFSSDQLLSRLEEFAVGTAYPQLAQLVTFRAPEDRPSHME